MYFYHTDYLKKYLGDNMFVNVMFENITLERQFEVSHLTEIKKN